MLADEYGFVAFLKHCQSLAASGSLSRERRQNGFFLPTNPTPQQADYFLFQGTRPPYYAAGLSEIESFFPLTGKTSLDTTQEMANRRNFGALPLIVLHAGASHPDSRLSDADNRAMAAFLLQGRKAVAARSTRGQLGGRARGHKIKRVERNVIGKALQPTMQVDDHASAGHERERI
jgi:hypothetical protein